MAVETNAPSTRRSILAAGLGGLAALVAAALGRPSVARADNGDPVTIGSATNTGTSETVLENTTANGTTFKAIQGVGRAVWGQTNGGTALYGRDDGTGYGLSASSESGTAALAEGGTGTGLAAVSQTSTGLRAGSGDDTPSTFPDDSYRSGVIATVGGIDFAGEPGGMALNTDEVAVYGFSDVSANSAGVWGDTWDGIGVVGTGAYGVIGNGTFGVYGAGTSYGLFGQPLAASGYGLYTNGKIKFNGRSGRSYVPTGRQYKEVPITGMTTSSIVIATLQTNRAGFYVQSVLSYTGRFRLYLNRVAPGNTYFSYLVIG